MSYLIHKINNYPVLKKASFKLLCTAPSPCKSKALYDCLVKGSKKCRDIYFMVNFSDYARYDELLSLFSWCEGDVCDNYEELIEGFQEDIERVTESEQYEDYPEIFYNEQGMLEDTAYTWQLRNCYVLHDGIFYVIQRPFDIPDNIDKASLGIES